MHEYIQKNFNVAIFQKRLIHLNQTTWACVLGVPMRVVFEQDAALIPNIIIRHFFADFCTTYCEEPSTLSYLTPTQHLFLKCTLPQTFFDHFQSSSAFSSQHYYTIKTCIIIFPLNAQNLIHHDIQKMKSLRLLYYINL